MMTEGPHKIKVYHLGNTFTLELNWVSLLRCTHPYSHVYEYDKE